jgi:predicted dithiol-disulfide oxidoreductase (DUF899 family)
MTTHKTGTREEWLAARLELLEAEKELTRRSDELARRRQELPWVRIDKEYSFETVRPARRSRTASAAPSSTSSTTTSRFQVVSRAPLEKLQAYKRRMGWTFPWASSYGSDFNFDFQVSQTEEQQRSGVVEYNFHEQDVRPYWRRVVKGLWPNGRQAPAPTGRRTCERHQG